MRMCQRAEGLCRLDHRNLYNFIITYIGDCDIYESHSLNYFCSRLWLKLAFIISFIKLKISHSSCRITMNYYILNAVSIIVDIENISVICTN